jgi:hypothetical protein
MSHNVLLFLFFIPVVLRGLLVVQVTRFGKEYLWSDMARGYTSSLIPRVLGEFHVDIACGRYISVLHRLR